RALGMFINTLPVRIDIGDEGAEATVRRTHALLADLMRHEHASLALAQRCSAVAAPAPLFSCLLNYRHTPPMAGIAEAEAAAAWNGIQGVHSEERTNYPLTLSINDSGEGFGLTVHVVERVGPMRVCRFMHTAIEHLLDTLEERPAAAVRAIDVMPAQEREQVERWNGTDAAYPAAQCIHELIEAQVARTPDAIAVTYGHESLTYAQLNARANQLAHYLRARGVVADARVAI